MNKTAIAVVVTAIISVFIGCSAGQMKMIGDKNRELAETKRYYKSQYKDSLDAYKQYVAATENLLSEIEFYKDFDPYYNGPDEMKRRKGIAYSKYCDAFNKISKYRRMTPVTSY